MSSNEPYGSISTSGEEFTRCAHCGYQNCDVRVLGCRCAFHARCITIPSQGPLKSCPSCRTSVSSLSLFSMSFREIDEARKTTAALANNSKRNKKRKGSSSIQDPFFEGESRSGEPGERRSGRWTKEEMLYVDELIARFESGEFPLQDGVKLNDFLSGILKSKQSRLTKKMKNAKLSARSFQRVHGYIADPEKARHFSSLEDAFFHSVQCHQERAEIKFHTQKEWRELFSAYCLSVGQSLDANSWLSSVEEMDRRESMAKDVARMAKRKLMMGQPTGGQVVDNLSSNFNNSTGIDAVGSDLNHNTSMNNNSVRNPLSTIPIPYGIVNEPKEGSHLLTNGKNMCVESSSEYTTLSMSNKAVTENKSPPSSFLSRVIAYIEQNAIPFEHVDAWVPSFVPGNAKTYSTDPSSTPLCRLCYAGSISLTTHTGGDRTKHPLNPKEQYNLKAFAEYSEKFSFDVGCGLPGRVYQSGVPTWEQSVQNAPAIHFERSNGANQWGIRTVVGIPVPSPNVGRIVITLYSLFDREKDQDMVVRLCDEFTRLAPCPRWKLVVELGEENRQMPAAEDDVIESSSVSQEDLGDSSLVKDSKDSRIYAVVSLLGEYMPSDPSSHLASYIPGFMAMRLMMLKPSWTDAEKELVQTLVASYTSYTNAGRSKAEVAVLLARDCMFLVKHQSQYQPQALSPMQTSQSNAPPATSGYLSNIKSFI